MIWLDRDITPKDTPNGTVVKLLGLYDNSTLMVTINLIIDHKGTEYKLTRLHRKTFVGDNQAALMKRFERGIQHFIRRYSHAPISNLIKQFLKWSNNPAHEVLRPLSQSQH